MTVLDSSVWIALCVESDSQHAKAQRLVDTIRLPIVLHEYVLLEVCTVLSLRVNKDASDHFLDLVLDNKDVELFIPDEQQCVELISFYRQGAHPKLSFTDVALLYCSRRYPVVTFDKHLQKQLARSA